MAGSENKYKIVVSPFYPFDEKIFCDLFKNNKYLKDLSDDIVTVKMQQQDPEKYLSYLDAFVSSQEAEIILVGFGFFTNLMLELGMKYSAKVKKVILIEPDFTNIIYSKFADISGFDSFKKKKLVKFYLDNRSVKRKPELNPSSFKDYFSIYKTLIQRNLNFRYNFSDLCSKNIDISIFWNVMEKESWPLPQILSEDYDVDLYSFKDDIYSFLMFNNGLFIERLIAILKK